MKAMSSELRLKTNPIQLPSVQFALSLLRGTFYVIKSKIGFFQKDL
jgi:hypothetical protein